MLAKTEQELKGLTSDKQRTDYREGATITSSPPPKVGCDRTVINGCNPLESKHGLDRD
jgi:hypothetical protein